MTTFPRFAVITAAFFCLTCSVLVPSSARAEGALTIPVWTDLFTSNGKLKDVVDENGAPGANGMPDCADPPYMGIDAIFVGDWISDGVATDMSALSDADNLEDVIVWNGTVQRQHDVGNAFVYATTDGASPANLVLYGAAERLGTFSGNSYIEFEFNQGKVRAPGPDMPLYGNRSEDDLLVRLNLYQGALSSADIRRWSETDGYLIVATIIVSPGAACSGDGVRSIACDPYLASGEFDYNTEFEPWENYPRDLYNTPVETPLPDGLVEFGINVGDLLGTSPSFTSILVRTPEDIILDSFRNLGYWAQAN